MDDGVASPGSQNGSVDSRITNGMNGYNRYTYGTLNESKDVVIDTETGTRMQSPVSPEKSSDNNSHQLSTLEPEQEQIELRGNHVHPTSYLDTMFHLMKASLGTGILAMPNAFRHAGYLVGLIGTCVIGFMCTYNIHVLLMCEEFLCAKKNVPYMSFPETVEAAFENGPTPFRRYSKAAKFMINLFLVMYQLGSSSIYVVFISTNTHSVYMSYSDTDFSVRQIIMILTPLFVLICWIRNLKLLVPFSTAANCITFLSFCLIFGYVFEDVPSFENREAVGDIHGMPLFFGTVLFAMEAIGVIMPLKNEMKHPEKFGSLFGVLNASMVPITILYTFIGFFGYLKYGDATDGSITLNLPSDRILAQLVKVLYAISIFITYALSCYVAFEIIWKDHLKKHFDGNKHIFYYEYAVRTGIVLVTIIMAMAVPNLDLFISLVGALCLSTMGVLVPPMIELLSFWEFHKGSKYFPLFVTKNVIIMLIAVLAFIIGVSTSVSDIIAHITKPIPIPMMPLPIEKTE